MSWNQPLREKRKRKIDIEISQSSYYNDLVKTYNTRLKRKRFLKAVIPIIKAEKEFHQHPLTRTVNTIKFTSKRKLSTINLYRFLIIYIAKETVLSANK